MAKSTNNLTDILKNTHPDNLKGYFDDNNSHFKSDDKAFSYYIRDIIAQKGFKENEVFIRADIGERYGYKLLTDQKRTKQRDVILRICLAATLDLEQTNKALKLYGMNELYAKDKRDSVVMSCLYHNIYDVNRVNEVLESNKLLALKGCRND